MTEAITNGDVLESATAKVAELEAIVQQWTDEEAAAREAIAAAQEQLESASLDEAEAAYGLYEEIAEAEGQAAAAASLGGSARKRLAAARRDLAVQRAAMQRTAAGAAWDQWRTHVARLRALLGEVAELEGVLYAPSQRRTAVTRLLDTAKDMDAAACRLEVEAVGESAVLRADVHHGGSVRGVWIGFAGQPLPENDPRANYHGQRGFRVTVDGAPLCEGTFWSEATFRWVRREVPADAVVAIEGLTVRQVLNLSHEVSAG